MSKPDFHFCVGNSHFKLCYGTASIYFYWCVWVGGGGEEEVHVCVHAKARVWASEDSSAEWVLSTVGPGD